VASGSLTAITIAYIAPQIMGAIYFFHFDAHRQFPFLDRRRTNSRPGPRWIAGQFRRALPFAIAGGTEIALQNLPVLFVSAIVADRIAVAQWGLTRVVAGLVRGLCLQATLPIAAELGHDRAIGAKQALRRLYARGSVLVTLLASVVVSALLPFWPDFFALWTHGVIPYDPLLMLTLLIGAQVVAPSMLALGYDHLRDACTPRPPRRVSGRLDDRRLHVRLGRGLPDPRGPAAERACRVRRRMRSLAGRHGARGKPPVARQLADQIG
jgi:O-antigen/teichoic acid export membrane protein